MSLTREQLFEELWSEPALKVAARHGVSSSYLARVCGALNVPCPPRGYWQKLERGHAAKRPSLPPARAGDQVTWSKGDALPLRYGSWAAATRLPTDADFRHTLVVGAKERFETGWVTDAGYLRARRQNIADIFTSKATLPRALDLANELFKLLERLGHRVALNQARFGGRPPVDHRENAGSSSKNGRGRVGVGRITGVDIGSVFFDLTLCTRSANPWRSIMSRASTCAWAKS